MNQATKEEQTFNRTARSVAARDAEENRQDRLQDQVDDIQAKLAKLFAASRIGKREESEARGGSLIMRAISPRRSVATTDA